MSNHKKEIFVDFIESNKKETVDVMETILFTNIRMKEVSRSSFLTTKKVLSVLSRQNELNMNFDNKTWMMKGNIGDLKYCFELLETSVKYN